MTEKFSLQRSRELLELADKAIPGPWQSDKDWKWRLHSGGHPICNVYDPHDFTIPDDAADEEGCSAECEGNLAFIVSTPDLAAQLRVALAVIQKQREALESVQWSIVGCCPLCGGEGSHSDGCVIGVSLAFTEET